ncbi:MAG TPA: hypothetical protein VLA37_13985 [Sphingomonadaceae bacterium]|nr:hypothetical protein [Sphingomonadaceae bacterium]
MIIRIWNGRVPAAKAQAYLELMRTVAIPEYSGVPGNLGAWCLHRRIGDIVHVRMVSRWESHDAIRGFAGEDIARARYFDFDKDFLLDFPAEVEHWEIAGD